MADQTEVVTWDIDIDFEEIDREVKELADRVYGNYSSFMNALISDAKEAADLLRARDTGFARRTYLRSFFAFADGALFARRTIVYEYTKRQADSAIPKTLTDAERMLLQEINYELDDNGTVRVRDQNFQPFLKFLRFTFRVDAKHHRKPFSVDYGYAGWASFRTAHEVRNRITHPKSQSDLTITDDELANIRAAVRWFLDSLKST